MFLCMYVLILDTPVEVESVSAEEMVILTPPEPEELPAYPGKNCC